MSWGLFDRLKFGAKPVWLVRITVDGIVHRLATGSTDYNTLVNQPTPGDAAATWRKADVVIPKLGATSDTSKKTVDVSLATNDALAQTILATGGRANIEVEIFQAFHSDPQTECRAQFFGSVRQLRPTNRRLRLACQDGSVLLDNQGVNRIVQIPCPYMLFSPECGVSQAAYSQAITVTGGAYLTYAADLSAFSVGQFNYGRLIFGQQAAVVLTNTLGQINLNSVMPQLEAALESGPQAATLLPGCAKTTGACVAYDNILNYGGFHKITDNPYDGNGIL